MTTIKHFSIVSSEDRSLPAVFEGSREEVRRWILQHINSTTIDNTEIYNARLRVYMNTRQFMRDSAKSRSVADKYNTVLGPVEAVRVTERNIHDVAFWCGGLKVTRPLLDAPYPVNCIVVNVIDRRLQPVQENAFVGDWIVKEETEDGRIRQAVYADQLFLKLITDAPADTAQRECGETEIRKLIREELKVLLGSIHKHTRVNYDTPEIEGRALRAVGDLFGEELHFVLHTGECSLRDPDTGPEGCDCGAEEE